MVSGDVIPPSATVGEGAFSALPGRLVAGLCHLLTTIGYCTAPRAHVIASLQGAPCPRLHVVARKLTRLESLGTEALVLVGSGPFLQSRVAGEVRLQSSLMLSCVGCPFSCIGTR